MNVLNELHSATQFRICAHCQRASGPCRQRLSRGEAIPRHRHAHPFAAVVLGGAYVEAGDSGLHRVEAGSVLFHDRFEHHLDRVDRRGAEVLSLPAPGHWSGAPHARVADVDAIARLAASDVPSAVTEMLTQMRSAPLPRHDWPGELADALLADPDLSLGHWAHHRGMHPGSLSRGFRQVFAVSPKAFRLQARTHAALRLYRSSPLTASAIAHACGFADQAHLSRSIAAMTGTRASTLRG